jgi:hypothetical protein
MKLGKMSDLPIPDRTLGFTVLVHGDDVAQVIGVARLKPPNLDDTIFNFANAGHATQLFANLGWIGAGDPMSDGPNAMPVTQGTWHIWLGNDGKVVPPAHVDLWVRRTEDGNYHGGVVDVNVFVAPGAATQDYLNQVLAGLFPAFTGLGVGTVTFYTLPDQYVHIDNQDEYRQLVSSTGGIGTVPALNMFVVGSFDAQFGGAIGIAAGIPGNPVQHGTPLSGVAYAPQGNAAYDASVLLHEIGHLAGLFHTTEMAVTETDPLSDTPECSHAMITSTPDQCPDKPNVMFPIAYGGGTFTPHQQVVVHGSILYRGAISEGAVLSGPVSSATPWPLKSGITLLGKDAKLATRRSSNPVFVSSPDSLERVLGGVWCGNGDSAYAGVAARLAGSSGGDRLKAIALDSARGDVVRARALLAFARLTDGSSQALSLAERLAKDEGEVASVRIAGLDVLRSHTAGRARRVAEAVSGSEDVVVSAAAKAAVRALERQR